MALLSRASASHLVRASFEGLAIQVLGKIFGTALLLFLTHTMAAADFGAAAYARAWPTFLGFLLTFGFAGSAFRFIPEYLATQQPDAVVGYVRWTTMVSGTAGVIAGCILAIAALLSPIPIDHARSLSLAIVAFCIPASVIMSVLQAACRALGFNWLAYFPLVGLSPLVNLILAAVVYFATARLSYVAATITLVAGWIVAMAYQSLALRAHLRHSFAGLKPTFHVRNWTKVAVPVFATLLAGTISSQGLIVIGGSLLATKEVGIVSVAFTLATFLSLIRIAVIGIVAPDTSARYARRDLPGVFRSIIIGTSLCGLLVLAGDVFFASLGPLLLTVFGKHFEAAYPALVLFCVSETITAIGQPTFQLLTVSGRERIAAVCTTISAVVCIGSVFYLTPRYGVEGMAYAAIISSTVSSVSAVIFATPLLLAGYSGWRDSRATPAAQVTAE